MTDDERIRIAEQYFDGDPAVLARLRRDPDTRAVLDALDLVAWDLALLRDEIKRPPARHHRRQQ
ncbi:hypothetical protein ACFYVR_23460 [Rhodococcus sp. NPDC003318]|uniref:hypothetical protein n=1 Tax=Rhodococcus sp. NPDC003318 TaxID=3364503 RepID=UPI00368FDD83